jgi:hypothetical protein
VIILEPNANHQAPLRRSLREVSLDVCKAVGRGGPAAPKWRLPLYRAVLRLGWPGEDRSAALRRQNGPHHPELRQGTSATTRQDRASHSLG